MEIAEVFAQYMEHVFIGKRCESRELIQAALDRGICAQKLVKLVLWPAMEQTEKLFRAGKITRLVEHMATRIHRTMADQLQAHMARKPRHGMRLLVLCGAGEAEELGAQMTADLFEAEGWTVYFLGSGVPNDEVVHLLSKVKPDVLCVFGSGPQDVPELRRLIDMIRDIGAHDQMQVVMSGGVFNRAPGLAEEIRADLFATDAKESLKVVMEHPVRVARPDLPQPGRRRKGKRAGAAGRQRKPRRRVASAAS